MCCELLHASLLLVMQETWDILCLLLMIRINYHHQLIMNKRRIPCLDDYLDRINLALWPRFKVPYSRHCLLLSSFAQCCAFQGSHVEIFASPD